MNQLEYEQAFKPDFDVNIYKRLELFEAEFLELESTNYKSFFFSRPAVNDKDDHDRLWNHYNLSVTYIKNEATAAFGFKTETDLDYEMKNRLFSIFFKHFPNGVQTSLVGHPGNHF